jgi:hypothetical protein
LVVGRKLIVDEDLQLALMLHIPVGMMYVNTSETTLAQFVASAESSWDKMAEWERERLATA